MVYILDLVKAVFLALESDENGEAFNIAGEDMLLKEYYSCCLAYMEGHKMYKDNMQKRISAICTEKAKQSLNWTIDFTRDINIQEEIDLKQMLYQ